MVTTVVAPPASGSQSRNLVTVIPASGASQSLSAASQLDPAYDVTLTANCAFSLAASAAVVVQTILVRLTQDTTGGRVPSFPANVAWDLGNLPAFSTTPGVKDTVAFTTWDGGATWEGSVIKLGTVTPAAPDAPTATVLPGHGQARVYIFDGLPHGSPVTAHAIYRGTTSGFTPGAGNLVATYATTSGFIYTDTGLTDGTPYYYRVAAINATGPSVYSPEYTVTPSNNRYFNGTGLANVYSTPVLAENEVQDGYLDIQAYTALTDITAVNSFTSIWNNAGATTANSSYFMFNAATGIPTLAYFDATTTTVKSAASTATLSSAAAALPYIANGVGFWTRWVLNASAGTINGFASGTATCFTAPDNGSGAPGTWTMLGTVVTGQSTTGIRVPASPQPIVVGGLAGTNVFNGKFYKLNHYTSTGALRVGVDFTAMFSGQTGTFNDNAATPNSFLINGTIN